MSYSPKSPVGPNYREIQAGWYWADIPPNRFDEFYRWVRANRDIVKIEKLEPPASRPTEWWPEPNVPGGNEPYYWISFEVTEPVKWYGFGGISAEHADSREDTAQKPPPPDFKESLSQLMSGLPKLPDGSIGQAVKYLAYGVAGGLLLSLIIRARR